MSGHPNELISRGTREAFRNLMNYSTQGDITNAFWDAGFRENTDSDYVRHDNNVRRVATERFLAGIDWTDPDEVKGAIRVFERLLRPIRPDAGIKHPGYEQFCRELERDGFAINADALIARVGLGPTVVELNNLPDPATIREYLGIIQRDIPNDPTLAVENAKLVIESTAKVVLRARGGTPDDDADVQDLIVASQKSLALQPSGTTPGLDGSDAVKTILVGASAIAIGAAELSKRVYDTRPGLAGAPIGVSERHAHLAVNAAVTWSMLMLDTLADPNAPWRKGQKDTSHSQSQEP